MSTRQRCGGARGKLARGRTSNVVESARLIDRRAGHQVHSVFRHGNHMCDFLRSTTSKAQYHHKLQ
eukprot:2672335-Amphidinium_carterae.1